MALHAISGMGSSSPHGPCQASLRRPKQQVRMLHRVSIEMQDCNNTTNIAPPVLLRADSCCVVQTIDIPRIEIAQSVKTTASQDLTQGIDINQHIRIHKGTEF
jgi:hypothetical protein